MNYNTYLEQVLSEKKKLIPNEDVYVMVQKLHRNPDDFFEGDLGKRLDDYEYYELKDIDISDLNLDEWDVRDYLVERIRKEIEKNPKYPPVVIDHEMSIIDGIHRANALNELGYNKIKAYVGVEKL